MGKGLRADAEMWATTWRIVELEEELKQTKEALEKSEKARFDNAKDAQHYKSLYFGELDRRDRDARLAADAGGSAESF